MKRILINSSYGDELRVALVDGAKLYDFDTESPERTLLKGSIFKATVSRVESSLDAAFVNFGSERHGFLPLKDLSSDFYEKNSNGKSIASVMLIVSVDLVPPLKKDLNNPTVIIGSE